MKFYDSPVDSVCSLRYNIYKIGSKEKPTMTEEQKENVIGRERVYVMFDYGCCAYVGVTLYEGKSFEECLRLRDNSIESYFKDGKWINLK